MAQDVTNPELSRGTTVPVQTGLRPVNISGLIIPVAGAVVTMTQNSQTPVSRQIETDATGAYSITIDPDSYGGDYTISVAAPGFVSSSVNLSTLPGGSTITKDFTLVAPGVVQGIVEDSKGGPVVGASVSIGAKRAATDSKGTYSMTVDPGAYAVSVSQKGFFPSQVNFTVPDGTAITQNFTLVTMVPGAIQGTATFDGQPAAGATVSVGSQQTTTDAKGSYSLAVDPGTYEISAIKGVLGCSDISVTVPNGTTVTREREQTRRLPLGRTTSNKAPGRGSGREYQRGAPEEPGRPLSCSGPALLKMVESTFTGVYIQRPG